MKYIPLIGTYARVLTESDSLVYSTSSAYLTSTYSSTLDNYLGISTNDPLKKVHIRNSGILIDGSEAEQDKSLGDPNWARIVVDTGASNVQDILDFRNDQGRVLFVSGAIEGGNRYPSVSIGTSSTDKLFQITDYYSTHTFLELTRTGSFSQINTNGFKLINNDFDSVFATVSGSGAYYDDGVTVKFAGVADNSNAGGTFGSVLASIDRNSGIFNQVAVQSDYAYMSVIDVVNNIYSNVSVFTHSLSLEYASAPSATIEEITLSDYGIKNTITGTFSIQDIIGNDLVSVSDNGTVSIYGLTNSSDTNVVTWNSTTKELGVRNYSRNFVLTREISFETGEQGIYMIVVPDKCKLIYPVVRVTKAIAGTDNATITLKNDTGVTMTGTAGVITLVASTPFSSQASGSITGNNTFNSGEQIRIETFKTTAGGKCSIDLLFEFED